MVGSRTIKVLVALVAAMTVGAFLLVLMLETGGPVLPRERDLAALRAGPEGLAPSVLDADVPHQPLKWRHIILHSAASRPDIAARCHFVITDSGRNIEQCIRPTELWRRQMEGNHAFVPGYDYNATSLGICLEGDFSRQGPSARQFEAAVALTQALQQTFNIPRDRVFLYRDLTPRSASPGAAFPEGRFNGRLLAATR